jgi:peptidoglycan/LPS O-acetylase OafA/YrhL
MTFGRLGAVDRQAKMSGMEGALPATWRLGYRPALDGLRGVAVLSVIFSHTHVPIIARGGIGVALFFALSGYLITALLLQEHDRSGRIDIGAFYMRRVRRLLPALLAMMLAVTVGTTIAGDPAWIVRYGWAVALYSVNWLNAIFSIFPTFVEHTWSLAVEEQFYLVWPMVIAIGLNLGLVSRRTAFRILVAVIVLVAVLRFAYWPDENRILFGTDTRGDAILAGCALALMPRLQIAATRVAIAAALVLVVYATGADLPFLGRPAFFLLGLPLVAIASPVIVAWALAEPRMLRWAPLVHVGRISYGLYLWHLPLVLGLEGVGVHGLLLPAIAIPISLAVAELSYRFIEQPFLRRRAPAITPDRPPSSRSQDRSRSALRDQPEAGTVS